VFEIDLRAKRKIQELGETWGLFLFNPTASNATVRIFARTLLAMP